MRVSARRSGRQAQPCRRGADQPRRRGVDARTDRLRRLAVLVAPGRRRSHAGAMDDDVVVLKLEGGKANAMTPELLDTLERMVDGFERSPAAAAVLTGYERYFSGGL